MFPLALPTNIYGVLTGRGGVQSTEFTSKGSQGCGVEQRGVGGSSRTQQTAPASCWTFRFLHVILKHPKFSSDQQCLLCGVQSSEGWGMEPSGQDFPVFVLDSEDPSPLQPRCYPSSEPRGPSTPQEAPQGPSSSEPQDRPSILGLPKRSVAKDQVFISFCFVSNFQSIVGRYFYKIQFK